jgi:hypothetical protein
LASSVVACSRVLDGSYSAPTGIQDYCKKNPEKQAVWGRGYKNPGKEDQPKATDPLAPKPGLVQGTIIYHKPQELSTSDSSEEVRPIRTKRREYYKEKHSRKKKRTRKIRKRVRRGCKTAKLRAFRACSDEEDKPSRVCIRAQERVKKKCD